MRRALRALENAVLLVWIVRFCLCQAVAAWLTSVRGRPFRPLAARMGRAAETASVWTAWVALCTALAVDGHAVGSDVYRCESTAAPQATVLIACAAAALHLGTTDFLPGLVTYSALLMVARGSGLAFLAVSSALASCALRETDAVSTTLVVVFHSVALAIAQPLAARCGAEGVVSARLMMAIGYGEAARWGFASVRRGART